MRILYASEDEKVAIDNEGVLTITAPDGTVSATGGPTGETPTTAATGEEPAQQEQVAPVEGDAEME